MENALDEQFTVGFQPLATDFLFADSCCDVRDARDFRDFHTIATFVHYLCKFKTSYEKTNIYTRIATPQTIS